MPPPSLPCRWRRVRRGLAVASRRPPSRCRSRPRRREPHARDASPSLSLLEYAQRERGSPGCRRGCGRSSAPSSAASPGCTPPALPAAPSRGVTSHCSRPRLPPPPKRRRHGGVGGGDWRLTGLDGCVWCADGGAAGGGGSDAPLLATTAELTRRRRRGRPTSRLWALSRSRPSERPRHAADVLIRHAPAATEALSERLARGSPAAAEPAAAATSARLEAVAAERPTRPRCDG